MHKCQSFSHNQGIYLNEYMQVAKHKLFHDEGSCPIETSQLICSGNQYTGFCIIGTSVMKDWRRSSSTYTESLFLHAVKHNLFVFCFFSIWLFFQEYSRFTRQQVKGKAISLYPFYHFQPLCRHLDIRWVIDADSVLLCRTGSLNRTWNLWYTLFRTDSYCTSTGSCCC